MSLLLVQLAILLAWAQALRALSRHVGPRYTGLLLGLPSTTAITLVACGYQHGPEAVIVMADAALLGLVAAVALPLAYARGLRPDQGLPRALARALAAYTAAAAGLSQLPPIGVGARLALATAALLVASCWSARGPEVDDPPGPRRPCRIRALSTLASAACVLLVQALQDAAGTTWAGWLAPFPGVTLTALVASHAEAGPAAARRMACAVPRGGLGTLAFLAAFRLAGPRLGPVWGAFSGYAVALATVL
ncbi:MAG: hypothetical protein IRY99_21045, partial [Isosphaeraceae bacterium]|nr:hypothetical protein [Isosphaeraceae bacterium]